VKNKIKNGEYKMTQITDFQIGDILITSKEMMNEMIEEFGTEILDLHSPIEEIYKIDEKGNYYLRDHITKEIMEIVTDLSSFRKATETEITKDKLKRLFNTQI
jgi:hypothetical protein